MIPRTTSGENNQAHPESINRLVTALGPLFLKQREFDPKNAGAQTVQMCQEIQKSNAHVETLFVCWHGTGRSPNNPEVWFRTLRLKIPTAQTRTEIATSVADALLHNQKGPLQAVFCFLDEVQASRFGPPENWRFTYIFQQQAKALGIPVHYMEQHDYHEYPQIYLSYKK